MGKFLPPLSDPRARILRLTPPPFIHILFYRLAIKQATAFSRPSRVSSNMGKI